MSYLKVRELAVQQIKDGMLPIYPKMRIEAHPGAFTEQTIKQEAQRTPAILTSLLRAADGVYSNSITFVSWVLYRASNSDKLYDGALKIISALIPVIRNANFDLAIKDVPIEAECLYSGALDAIAVTLWAVKWELVLGERAFIHGSLEGIEQIESFHGTATVGRDETKITEE